MATRPAAGLGAVLLWTCSAAAQGTPTVFSVTGDIPYSFAETTILRQQIADHNRYSPAEFVVHLGDIKSGTSSCSESVYQNVAATLLGFAVPTFVLPGDNEWNDCSSPSQAWTYWVRHFDAFDARFCGSFAVERQAVRRENFAFVHDGVLFVGINIVGGRVHDSSEWSTRLGQDATWVEQQLAAHRNDVRAAVICGHAGPGSSAHQAFFNRFHTAGGAFVKPVLYVHGDLHTWIDDRPWSEPNLRRVQVNNGGSEPPVEVTVSMHATNPFVLRRDPWSGSPPIVNMPPCVQAGPDRSVVLPATAALQGSGSDDGDPAPAQLAFAWSQVSGPGSAQFAAPTAAATTAAFDVAGTYVLRLTASDGALQTADDVRVDVEGGQPPAAVLSIGDATIVEGDAGTATLTFIVALAGSSGGNVTVAWATAPGSASAGIDYVSQSGPLSFAGGSTSHVVTVTVNGDTGDEVDEVLYVDLANPVGATLGDARGQGTIQDDDVPLPGRRTIVVVAADDAHVKSTSQTSNYGSEPRLRVRGGSTAYQTYVKFRVDGLDAIPVAATLRLWVEEGGGGGDAVYAVANTLRNTDTPWTEATLKWSNAPAVGGAAVATVGSPPLGTWVELDVSSVVLAAGTYTFALQTAVSSSTYYGSSEGAHAPQLVVTLGDEPVVPPQIAGFAPASGAAGSAVIVTGTGFLGTGAVRFGATPATEFHVDSATQLTVVVPLGAGDGPITVVTAGGSAASATVFDVTAPPPVLTFAATDDANVQSGSPTGNYGAAATLRVRSAGSPTYRSHLKFAVAGIDGNVTGAKLRLWVEDDGADAGSVFATANELSGTSTPWTESTLAWNNAPLATGVALAVIGAVAPSVWIEVDVSTAVTANGTYSFVVQSTDAHSVYFASSESSHPPQLVVTTAAPAKAQSPAASARDRIVFALPHPNPSPGATTFEFAAPRGGTVRLDVFDVRGARIRRLVTSATSGTGRIAWDGRADSGQPVVSGIYFYELSYEGARQRGKVVLRR